MKLIRLSFAIAIGAALLLPATLFGQEEYVAPRTRDGLPDLEGIWQARNTAAFGLEAHNAAYRLRGGQSVIVDPADGKIPYLPEAEARRDANYEARLTEDPVEKCFLPGVPRVMYMPYPFQISQSKNYIFIASEFAHTSRTVYMDGKGHYAEAFFWMGDARGYWDGDTLVIDSANFNGNTWLDAAGDFHSEQLHVIERLTRVSENVIQYEATMEDPLTYSQPWTIRMNLYRDQEPNAMLLEYECHVYLEDEGIKTFGSSAE